MTDHLSPQAKAGLHLALYPHHHTMPTRSSDCFGTSTHIPNSKIAEYGDDARLALVWAILGENNPASLQMVEARFHYLIEVTFPGTVTIGVGIVGMGSSSVRVMAGYFRDGRCYVLGHFVLVKVMNGASAPLTEAERARAAPFLIANLPA